MVVIYLDKMYSPTSYEGIAVGYWTLLIDYWTNNRTGYSANYITFVSVFFDRPRFIAS